MKSFLNENFLLSNETGSRLFHETASKLPVIDFHNHLDPLALGSNRVYPNIAQLWVTGDPYKHRAMRINGIPERLITGDATDQEKFKVWAETLPQTLGNPLFHWSCLEMERIFGVEEVLCPENADAVWEKCNDLIREKGLTGGSVLKSFDVELLCTSDDLLDDLSPHKKATDNLDMIVKPSLRADSILSFAPAWIQKLAQQTSTEIKDLDAYELAISKKLDDFEAAGCTLSDHALDSGYSFSEPDKASAAKAFSRVIDGIALSPAEKEALQNQLLHFLGVEYGKRGWTLQLHMGAQRFTSSRLRKLAGPAGGYATIGNTIDIESLCGLLDSLEQSGNLPNVIIYPLNPADYEAIATLTGSFSKDGVAGKIQLGPAWWYNDHKLGIEHHMKILSAYGLLSRFVGMTTDSRSVLSFSRHEYFRRIACDLIGRWAEAGELPQDWDMLSGLVANISYYNSKRIVKLS